MGNGTIKLIIDRFEGSYALCETSEKKILELPAALLPEGAKEGDVLTLTLTIDGAATSERKKYIEDLTKDFWK